VTVMRSSSSISGSAYFDAQLLGGIVLHKGSTAEMRTEEGKTFGELPLPLYLNALAGKGALHHG